MRLSSPFDISTLEPNQGSRPFPVNGIEGTICRIIEHDIKETSSKEGRYLKLVFESIEKESEGARAYWNLNIENQNRQTMEIAYGQLSAIGYILGIKIIDDLTELHNKNLRLLTRIKIDGEKERVEPFGVLSLSGKKPGNESFQEAINNSGMGIPAGFQPMQQSQATQASPFPFQPAQQPQANPFPFQPTQQSQASPFPQASPFQPAQPQTQQDDTHTRRFQVAPPPEQQDGSKPKIKLPWEND